MSKPSRCSPDTATRWGSRPARSPGTPFTGIRFKSFEASTRRRTLDVFLDGLGGKLPPGFVVTLPKVTAVAQVAVLADVLGTLEAAYGLAEGSLRFEAQIETPQSINLECRDERHQ